MVRTLNFKGMGPWFLHLILHDQKSVWSTMIVYTVGVGENRGAAPFHPHTPFSLGTSTGVKLGFMAMEKRGISEWKLSTWRVWDGLKITVLLFTLNLCGCPLHGAYVEIRGQLSGIVSLLPLELPFTHWAISQALKDIPYISGSRPS